MDSLKKEKLLRLPFIPLRELVLFPQFSVRTLVGREKSLKALQISLDADRMIILATQKDQFKSDPQQKDIYDCGILARVEAVEDLSNRGKKVTFSGVSRARIQDLAFEEDTIFAYADVVSEQEVALNSSGDVFTGLKSFLEKNAQYPVALSDLMKIKSLNHFTDLIAFVSSISIQHKIELLREPDSKERARYLLQLARVLKSKNGNQEDEESLYAERKQFEEQDPLNGILRSYQRKIKAADLPENVKQRVQEEFDKLSFSHPNEVSLICNYLDWLLKFPWKNETRDNFDIKEVEETLEKNHYGLKEVKERILEYLSVKMLSGRSQGEIICFSGPPGVGKSSLGKSIAEAVNKKFVRASLGGVSDESEIRGHRRTYLGAYPGRIIKGLVQAGSLNPVFLLDEIDKLGNDFRGDPASALLEVLDPETNNAFLDRYLDLEVDLSRVFFIATANNVQNLSPALRDRLDIIEIPEYTENEKLEIARRFLIPRSLQKSGLKSELVKISDETLQYLIHFYTREAGVRNLERIIDKLNRRISFLVVKEKIKKDREFIIDRSFLEEVLGAPYFFDLKLNSRKECGVAIGLAWTQAGGEILIVEARLIPGKGDLILTGSLGEVMKESSTASWSWVKGQLFELGFDLEQLKNFDLHLHFPEGATPKDGPSAGITIAVAMLSEISAVPASSSLAMSGEITIQGRVLPVGGIKAKVLAAYRYGIKKIILPLENRSEYLKEIPANIQQSVTVDFVEDMAEVVRLAFANGIKKEKVSSNFRKRFIRQAFN